MRRHGFTLIELMIVVAIIAIILAIAIPSLMQSRKSAIETTVIGTLKAIVTTNEQYRLQNGVYAPNLGVLVPAIPQLVGNAALDEYVSNYQTNGYTYSVRADPVSPGVTADRYFYVDTSGVIRVSRNGPATSSSPPLD